MAFDHQQEDNISQINITPLVDVMLVLLVIFMVTAPILQQGVAVELPQVAAGPVDGQDSSMVITVSKDGKVHLDNRALRLEELQQTLVRDHAETTGAFCLSSCRQRGAVRKSG